MIDYLSDAQHIHDVIQERLQQTTADRRAQGKTGGGQPGKQHSSLNRAVVVAAVGALEAFNEDLALTAQPLDPQATPPASWYQIDGKNGMVQTPSPYNLRKLYWTFFRYDPTSDWDWAVEVAPSELGQGSTWRVGATTYQGPDASSFLDAMVKVRHGFAHQDKAQKPPAYAGIVTLTPTGRIAIHSHHATNALSVLLQFAVLTTSGLADRLSITGQFRWSTKMAAANWERLLKNTPAGALTAKSWKNAPQL
ncbi:hypothetical protein G3I39_23410 [Streptomyces fulvissimus]|uniref:Uncharacterized protein n=2 Tax=Streptomyces griseus group TaxID=629295 RepID=A0A6N9VBW3_STRMI|nr:hypothetical protein [Streptomyces microflavus]NEB69977.1 hypothetical protein [Streptomyces microflavus]